MTILLAPMEGVLDFVLRDILTRVGGVDRCVAEFIRINDTLLPERVFYRVLPELHHGGRTLAGVPVRAQLLGSDPTCLAENAAVLAALGPHGIDLNFGCPAKVVNRHGGGAALLANPELLLRIVAAVRRAVPHSMPVSAKMRLGVHDDTAAVDCALAIEAGGACELVVHARTKAQGYRPPAHWARIADIRTAVKIPVVANGDIWNVADAQRCRAVTGSDHLMLGRGMVADPGLALAIRAADANPEHAGADTLVNRASPAHRAVDWSQLLALIDDFWQLVQAHLEPRQQAGRLKQWLNFLRLSYPQGELAYQTLRPLSLACDVQRWLAGQHELIALQTPPRA